MERTGFRGFVCAMALGAIAGAGVVQAASLTEVPRATWAAGVNLPSYAKMYVYVPDKLAAKPPLVVSNHSCGSSATGQMGNTPKIKALADKNGFVMILPDNPGRNCWDVGSKAALTRDGGGDPHAIATMVRYALKKYDADSTRVYVVGGSSGGMMTQALSGIYPDLFVAAAPRAGVPLGCWAESYAESNQWSGPCSGGNVNKTAAQWGDLVRAINPGYTGHRPRMMIFHGEADETISFKNFGEAVEEWTNVLALPATPTATSTIRTSAYSYNRQSWKNACGYTVLEAWSSPGAKHSMTYEEDSIIKFFGLNTVGGKDPELAACPSSAIGSSATSAADVFALRGRELVLPSSPDGAVSVKIRNPAGRVLLAVRLSANRGPHSVSLASLPPGYHLASVVVGGGVGEPLVRRERGFVIPR